MIRNTQIFNILYFFHFKYYIRVRYMTRRISYIIYSQSSSSSSSISESSSALIFGRSAINLLISLFDGGWIS